MRYIDAEALTDHMLERYNELCEKYGDWDHYATGYGDAIDAIEKAPEADVVPKSKYDLAVSEREANVKGFTEELAKAKSEVERLYYNLQAVLEERAETKQEIAREIFEEIEKHGRKMQSSDFSGDFWDIAVLMSDIADLKKKYTEGE